MFTSKQKKEGRYRYHELPNRLPTETQFYDLGLSSYFLFLYTMLGYEFHIQAIWEMLRVCKEVRIFPLVDLDAKQTELVSQVIASFKEGDAVEIQKTDYEFQKKANKMVVIR